jgi:hypothetical protein
MCRNSVGSSVSLIYTTCESGWAGHEWALCPRPHVYLCLHLSLSPSVTGAWTDGLSGALQVQGRERLLGETRQELLRVTHQSTVDLDSERNAALLLRATIQARRPRPAAPCGQQSVLLLLSATHPGPLACWCVPVRVCL